MASSVSEILHRSPCGHTWEVIYVMRSFVHFPLDRWTIWIDPREPCISETIIENLIIKGSFVQNLCGLYRFTISDVTP